MAQEFYQSPASAGEDFRRARRQAALQEIISRLTGKSTELFSYEEVRQKLKGVEGSTRLLKDIPLAAIVGSVGRYNEFTRSFLPRKTIRSERWIRVKMAMTGLSGVPPIEVYRIGEVYFVQDGNHRVSVARQMGLTSIQAYVTEVRTKVPLCPEDQLDDLILKAEYAEFLEQTQLDTLRPGSHLEVTCPGRYPVLLEHIDVRRHFMGLEQGREIPYEQAVVHWYDTVYLPVVKVIRERGILWDFPKRTATDLYLYISQHRVELEESLGWEISLDTAVTDLIERFDPDLKAISRARERLRRTLIADEVEIGLSQRQSSKEPRVLPRQDRVINDILVAIDGEQTGWNTLEQAFIIAQREGARLQGLHVVPSQTQCNGEGVQAIKAEFNRRCAAAGIRGRLAIDVGECPYKVCERARWSDLVVVSLTRPPSVQQPTKLSSGFRTLLRRSPRPLLGVPGTSLSPLDRVLLAYDASPKAEEALYIATYLAGWWNIPLIIATVSEDALNAAIAQSHAEKYLKLHALSATFVQASGPVAATLLKTAETHACNAILMGGYGLTLPLEAVLGSTVNQVLRESRHPVLVCR